jgi:hypothetical protein
MSDKKKSDEQSKDVTVQVIISNMKPNTFADDHIYWKNIKSGLMKMNQDELTALNTLIVTCEYFKVKA